ncbi:MAG: homocysteine S-methyltransferase family protein [Gammaproteobacteria bacterium]|nr:homocysteine S-methyltransferase family protein [Gammaproteobacteria bacterium]
MNLVELLQTEKPILGDGSIYELLRRDPDVAFDEHIAHSSLIYDAKSKRVLEQVIRSYIEVAVSMRQPMVVTTTTWRANRERIQASAFADRAVNEDNARFMLDLRDSYADTASPIIVGGNIGPKGDAYKPQEALDADTAQAFHAYQIEALAASGVDFLQASTLPARSEALGIAMAMAATGLPYVISFVVEQSGCLLDGTLLRDAIFEIDTCVGEASANYAVNCVHPSVLHQALDKNSGIEGRIIGFSGNTSALSVAELDGLDELDTEEPDSFALANQRLAEMHNIRIIGGCCGTNPTHMLAIARQFSDQAIR